jgi:hypothetical protein
MSPIFLALGRASRVGAVLATAALAAACSSGTALRAGDASSPLVSMRMQHRFGGAPGGGGVELNLTDARASGEQQLGDFNSATLGDNTVNGPAQLKHTARVQQVQLLYNHLLFAGRLVEMEWFVGGTWVQTHWESISANPAHPRLSERESWYGPAGGVLGRLRLSPQLALEARTSSTVVALGGSDGGGAASVEVALAFKPVPQLALRAGIGRYESSFRSEPLTTHFSADARGLFIGLGLEF